jgi:hypothetical protein
LDERRATSLGLPKIDFHQHCTTGDEEGLALLLRSNAACNVERAVLLALRNPGEDASRANDFVLAAAAKHPTIIAFATVVEDDPHAADVLSDAIARGARGLKLIG